MSSKRNRINQKINRRHFLAKATTTLGLATVAGVWGFAFYDDKAIRRSQEKIYTFKDFRIEEKNLFPQMAIVHGTKEHTMLRAAIENIGGTARFIKKGDRVLIKPNVGWDRQPEQAANTNPLLVGAMVKLCKEAGASEVWVTDVPVNQAERCFNRSGIKKTVEEEQGKIKWVGDQDFVSTDLGGSVLSIWPVCRFFHDVDKVINMPIVKHHSLSRGTLSMKNWYGVLGGKRNQLHQNIHDSIVDLASAIQPTLTVMDATRVLKRNGPTGGNLEDVSIENTIVVGTDQVAIDAYSLKFLDLSLEDIPNIIRAGEKKVGTPDWRSLNMTEITV